MTPDASDRSRNSRSLYPCGRSLRPLRRPASVIVLGATGSIGRQAFDLFARYPERWRVVAVAIRSRVDELAALLDQLAARQPGVEPPWIAVTDAEAHQRARAHPSLMARLLPPGDDALVAAVTRPDHADCVVNALVGAVGLAPTIAAAERGLRIALANKESLVVGGDLVKSAVQSGGAELLPVDSEHSAIAQCLAGRQPERVGRVGVDSGLAVSGRPGAARGGLGRRGDVG